MTAWFLGLARAKEDGQPEDPENKRGKRPVTPPAKPPKDEPRYFVCAVNMEIYTPDGPVLCYAGDILEVRSEGFLYVWDFADYRGYRIVRVQQ